MRKITFLLVLSLMISIGFATNYSISSFISTILPTKNEEFDSKRVQANSSAFFLNVTEDFENAVGWEFSNVSATNQWVIGEAVSNGTGVTSLYISNDEGVTNAYTNSATSIVHAYKTFSLDADAEELEVSFDWRCLAESGTYDYLRVWITTDDYTPTEGTVISELPNERIQVGGDFNNNGAWQNFNGVVNVSELAGEDVKFIFEWKNDGVFGDNPPAAVDNLNISPVVCVGPGNLQVTNILAPSATISWSAPSATNVEGYEYVYSTTNTLPTTGFEETTETSVELTDLVPGSSYFVWVRTICDEGNSIWLQTTFNIGSGNDDCNGAVELTVNEDATCTITTAGNFVGATLSTGSGGGCDEWSTPLKDVWYKFTATETSHMISYTELQNTWSVSLQLFNNAICDAFETALYCGEQIVATNLVIGEEYYIRVFMTNTWGGPESEFEICVRTLSAPDNDECEDAITAPVNDGECVDTVDGTFVDSSLTTGFEQGCDTWSSPQKDVWFEFTATNDIHDITITGYTGSSINVAVYEATNGCDFDDPLICYSGTYLILGNLQPGTLYKIRVFSTDVNDQQSFTLCVNTPEPAENDECDDAIVLPVNDGEECVVTTDATFNGSTLSAGFNTTCDGWGTPYKDVWFRFTATSNTHGISLSNYENGFDWSIGLEIFSATSCEDLGTNIACNTDVNSQVNNLVPGNDYFIRLYATDMAINSDFTICINTLSPPIYVSETDYTVEELVKEVLVGNECLISNISWRTGTDYGDENGIGYFSKNGSTFDFQDGILLATSGISDAVGPPMGQGGGGSDWLGDDDLSTILAATGQNGTLRNASVLEFDFTPTITDFKFDFIFASNEYGTFQCNYSDAFAFLLTDLTTNVTTNLAVIPGTTIPVSVTTIRDGQYNSQCESENIEYFHSYHNQWDGLDPMLSPIGYYGRTVPMTAQTTVVPGRTYHIKMVIADYGPSGPDSGVDSGVFLLGGSFDIGSIDFGEGFTFDNNNALCYGDSYILDATVGEGFNYKWYKDGVLIPGANQSTYTVTETGIYKVEAIFGETDCGLEASVEIEFYPDLNDIIIDPSDIIICNETPTVDLTVREDEMIGNNSGVYVFEYYLSAQEAQNGTNSIQQPEDYIFDGVVTIYVKVVTPGANQCYAIKELLVDVLPVSDPMIIDDLIICNGYKLPILPQGQRYFTGSEATGEEMFAGTVLREGVYTLYVYSANGKCFEENAFTITVVNCIIPKGISPNFDGLNDGFDLTQYYPTSVTIYNRYGTIVYEHGNGYTKQWMGQDKNNKLLPMGTYFYKMTTETDEYTGWVYLQREIK